jgi:hypothetical protein
MKIPIKQQPSFREVRFVNFVELSRFTDENLNDLLKTKFYIHDNIWTNEEVKYELEQSDLSDIKRELKFRKELKKKKDLWEKNTKELYLKAVSDLQKSWKEVEKRMPPLVANASLEIPIDMYIHHLKNNFDDEDIWNSSQLCW